MRMDEEENEEMEAEEVTTVHNSSNHRPSHRHPRTNNQDRQVQPRNHNQGINNQVLAHNIADGGGRGHDPLPTENFASNGSPTPEPIIDRYADYDTESSDEPWRTCPTPPRSTIITTKGVPDLEYIDGLPREPNNPGTLNIIQWNCRSIQTASADLIQTLHNRNIGVALLSEVSCAYNYETPRRQFTGYSAYGDDYNKTNIYIAEDLRHVNLPLDERINKWYLQRNQCLPPPNQRIYATAVFIYTRIDGKRRNIILISLYRPPRKGPNATDYIQLLRMAKDELKAQAPKAQVDGWICGGDFNASHQKWGARKRDAQGRRLAHHLASTPQHVQINRKQMYDWGTTEERRRPRFHPTRTAVKKHKVERSWIDITLADAQTAAAVKYWRVRPLLHQSDHHQIYIELQGAAVADKVEQTDEGYDQWSWKITDKAETWEEFNQQLQDRWSTLETFIDAKTTTPMANREVVLEDIATKIKTLFHEVAGKVLGVRRGNRQWKKWISGKAQAASIRFHKTWYAFCRLRHPTSADWKVLERSRTYRDYMMGNHKTHYLTTRLCEHGVKGKKGYQALAECRDMNEHRGKAIPPQQDPDKPGSLISGAKQIAEATCTHYHRFNLNAQLPEHWCWHARWLQTMPELKRRPPYETPNMPQNTSTIPPVDEEEITPDRATVTAQERYDKYDRWIKRRTMIRRKSIKKRHPEELQKLNAAITKAEIRRTVRGFSSNKAQGPDDLHITFFKKTGAVGQAVLLKICNLMFHKWQMVPGIWKERIIRPLIKNGKKGDEMKHLRPVSLTSYVGKILEKIMVFRLSTYVIRLRLIAPIHFAYLRGRSTTDCIVYMVDQIQRNLNRRWKTHTVYFDLSSAFDTVQHQVLLWKLQHQFFITGPFLETLRHFLTNRRSKVRVNGAESKWQQDIIGMPQGGALSPLIYLLYVDDLAIINNIQGLKAAIYSDDISIFTTCESSDEAQAALQEAVFVVEWYCKHHGLVLNHDKTRYVIFASGNIKKTDKLTINMHRIDKKTGISSPTALEHYNKPIKYLGIWLDRKLDFRHHAAQVAKSVRNAWFIPQNNLRRSYKISADVPWTLYNTGPLAIFDYSAVLWPLLTKDDQKAWTRLYNRVLRSTVGSTKGESINQLCLQLGTFPLDVRLRLQVNQYFSRMIRTPVTTALHGVIEKVWWRRIRSRTDIENHKKKDDEDYIPDNIPLCARNAAKNTIIYQVVQEAHAQNNDDYLQITPGLEFHEIIHNMGHYNDLTKDWQESDIIADEFDDDWYERRVPHARRQQEYLIFTDGSVKNREGGQGYHGIRGDVYLELTKNCEDFDGYAALCRQQPGIRELAAPLSHRCSIDMCELQAIHDAVLDFGAHFTSQERAEECKKLQSVRIVSDSQTILRQISGEYKTRHSTALQLINEIKWNRKTLEENYGITTHFQWTASHTDRTKGNDAADEQARRGYDMVEGLSQCDDDVWRYYHQRAAINNCKRPAKDQMQLRFCIDILTSKYGETWRKYLNLDRNTRAGQVNRMRKGAEVNEVEALLIRECRQLMIRNVQRQVTASEWQKEKERIFQDVWRLIRGDTHREASLPGIRWNARFKKEMKHVSRNTTRILVGLRSGHNQLNHYRHMRLRIPNTNQGLCRACGQEQETMQHVLQRCTDPRVQEQVQQMAAHAKTLYTQAWHAWADDDDKQELPYWQVEDIDFTLLRTYLFPMPGMDIRYRKELYLDTAAMYQWFLKIETAPPIRPRRKGKWKTRRLQNRHHVPFDRGWRTRPAGRRSNGHLIGRVYRLAG